MNLVNIVKVPDQQERELFLGKRNIAKAGDDLSLSNVSNTECFKFERIALSQSKSQQPSQRGKKLKTKDGAGADARFRINLDESINETHEMAYNPDSHLESRD